MTSKEIIIKLLDEQKITGEEAYTLIHDIVRSEYYYPYITWKDTSYPLPYTQIN